MRFQMCHFVRTHRQYTLGIGEHILLCKKQDFDDYLVRMEQDAPLDEVALVITHLFHFHTCVLSETKFWTTNREHKIGMCSLLLGLIGTMQFVPLCYCTTQTGSTGENQKNLDLDNSANGQFSKSALPILTFFQKIQNGFPEIKVTFLEPWYNAHLLCDFTF